MFNKRTRNVLLATYHDDVTERKPDYMKYKCKDYDCYWNLGCKRAQYQFPIEETTHWWIENPFSITGAEFWITRDDGA